MRLVQRSLLFGRPSATRLCAKRPALQRLQLRKRRPERSVLMATCASAGPERTDLDVAIIGGGPGGLAVAKAIEVAFKGSMRTRVRRCGRTELVIKLVGLYTAVLVPHTQASCCTVSRPSHQEHGLQEGRLL